MLQFSADAVHSFFTLGPLECLGSSGQTYSPVTNANFISSACKLVNPPPKVDMSTETSSSLSTPLGIRETASTASSSPGKSKNTDHSTHRVTMTTTIATHTKSTRVTSELSYEPKSENVTVHSSITSDKSGVTVHSSITTKGNTATLPPVTNVQPNYPKVTVITNGSVSYITHIKGEGYDATFYILVGSSVFAFIILICVIIFVFLKRSGSKYVCCISCKRCGRKKNIPDIEVYRHTVPTEPLDAEQLEDMNHHRGAVEFGAYNVSNGQTVYHSVHRDSHVRKYVSFSASTSKL